MDQHVISYLKGIGFEISFQTLLINKNTKTRLLINSQTIKSLK